MRVAAMVCVGLAVVVAGAWLSYRLAGSWRRARVWTAMLVLLYVLALWASGSLERGAAMSRVFGNYWVRSEPLPVTWGTRTVHARAGQHLVITYHVFVDRGQVNLRVFPATFLGRFAPFSGTTVWTGSLEQTGDGTLRIPIAH
ncbi:MAG TPA: hypothetical protein VGJ70_02630, partial [Solirubrobacteraceae bacterium]